MSRLVVGLHWKGAFACSGTPGTVGFAPLAEAVIRHKMALRGRVVAFHAEGLSLDFSHDSLADVIDLVTSRHGELVGLGACGIGVAQGDVEPLLDAGVRVALSLGPGLVRAHRLARMAEAGEVLLDPSLEAVRAGHLLSRGVRLSTTNRQRLRGLRLDLRYPWLKPGALARLVRVAPGCVAPRCVATEELSLRPGELFVLVAPRGSGGTAWLSHLRRRLGSAALYVNPGAMGEPLGALRSALRHAVEDRRFSLRSQDEASLESLLAVQGLDLDAASHLVGHSLTDADQRVLLVDDAAEVDRDTLEALAMCAERAAVAVVARIPELAQLPVELARLPVSGSHELPMLTPEQANALVGSLTAGAMPEKVAQRWIKRGGGRPLAITEALLLGLSRGELVWDQKTLRARDRIGGRGRAYPAEHWLGLRLNLVSPEAQKVLDAVALHGGEATQSELGEFFALVGEPTDHLTECKRLEQDFFLLSEASQVLRVASSTLRELLLARVSRQRRASWHRALFELWGEGDRPLALASAVVHAVGAHQVSLAQTVAKRAAAAAQAVGLAATAQAFEKFAGTGDVGWLERRGLAWRGLIVPEEPVRPTPCLSVPQIQLSRTPAIETPLPLPGRLPAELKSNDATTVRQLMARLRQASVQALAADRLAAMDSLARGEVGTALRHLRDAKDKSQKLSAVERSRAALAYGVALAAAGRTTEALLEALEGLARAREADDRRGERACTRFVAQLMVGSNQRELAREWLAHSERATPDGQSSD
ncbi:hypothetical protein ACFL5O_09410 [Myxococcota bacterium]